jgi:uncharacterized membrane protein
VVVTVIPDTVYPFRYLRYLLGTVFVVWFPGYSFVQALFPSTSKTEALGPVARFALSLSLSLAIVPVVGLLLNYTSWGVRLTPVVLSLDLLTVVLATVGVVRESRAR